MVARATKGAHVLVGEAKRTCSARDAREALVALEEKARRVPGLERARLDLAVFVLRKKGRIDDPRVIDASEIGGALR